MKFMLCLLSLIFVAGCTKDSSKPNVEVIQGMMEQPALKAQDFHPHDREKSSMLTPPAGTQPKNRKPYLCLLYTSPSPRDATLSRMPSSA